MIFMSIQGGNMKRSRVMAYEDMGGTNTMKERGENLIKTTYVRSGKRKPFLCRISTYHNTV